MYGLVQFCSFRDKVHQQEQATGNYLIQYYNWNSNSNESNSNENCNSNSHENSNSNESNSNSNEQVFQGKGWLLGYSILQVGGGHSTLFFSVVRNKKLVQAKPVLEFTRKPGTNLGLSETKTTILMLKLLITRSMGDPFLYDSMLYRGFLLLCYIGDSL